MSASPASQQITHFIIEERTEEPQSRQTLYRQEGDSEENQSDSHPFQHSQQNKPKIGRIKKNKLNDGTQGGNNRKGEEEQSKEEHQEGQPRESSFVDQSTKDDTMGMPIIQQSNMEQSETENPLKNKEQPPEIPESNPIQMESPPSPINNLAGLESGRYRSSSPQPERSTPTYMEESKTEQKQFDFNTMQTLSLREEEQPRHSSYGPRVKRYLSNSQSKGKEQVVSGYEPRATVSKFSGLSSSFNATTRSSNFASLERERSKVLPPLSISKLLLQHQNPQSPLSTALISLSQKLHRILEPTLNSFPFALNLLSPLPSLKSSITKHMSTLLAPAPPPSQVSSDWPNDKMTDFFMKYQPRYKGIKNSALVAQQGLALKRYKNCVYFGGMKAGLKEGSGVVVYFGKNGVVFEGRFQKDDKVQGVQCRDGQIYIGRFADGAKNDEQGMLLTKDKIYYGRFKKGLWVDHGIRVGDEGLSFYSEQLDAFKSPSQDLFFGHLNTSTNAKYGFGVQIFSNGDVYIGNYELSKPEGYGEYFWSTGASYKGSFLAGKRHGKGVWQMKFGDKYEGEYMMDKKCGEGVYTWRNGSQYKGQFQNDLRHGYGQMFYPDGRTYKGSWVDGIQKDRKYFEIKKMPDPKPGIKYVSPQNAFRQSKQLFRITKTGYKKTRISKAMQAKLQKFTEDRYQMQNDNEETVVPYKTNKIYEQDQCE